MKFRKKPVVIEAVQYFDYMEREQWPAGVCADYLDGGMDQAGGWTLPYIRTLEGIMQVRDGDWVITGIKGEKYPCKPDIFEQTYEAVVE